MKNLKVLGLALCAIIATSLTSCNDDDDNNNLSPAEEQAAFNTVKGSYDGTLIYAATNPNNSKDKSDSVSVKFDILTDSTLTIHSVPAHVLSAYVTDSTLKKTLADQPAQDLKCITKYVRVSPAEFVFAPTAANYTVKYGNKDNAKVQIAFASNGYCYGAYNATRQLVQMQVVVAGVYVDGEYMKDLLKQPFAFYIEAKK